MQQPDTLKDVVEFHATFRHPILGEPKVPSKKRCELRVSLLAEELEELKEAIEKKDIVAVADALCDLQYVLSGAVLEFGLGGKFKALFEEVHRSNMSKACVDAKEAAETIKYYADQDVDSYFLQSDNKYLIYRLSDHKTLKSINYSPANLSSIINQ